jgi:predicted HicB family RNase H-like nuclease
MNLMTVDGYSAKIEYDAETDLFRGEILGLSGGADFYGANPNQLRIEFKRSLDVFLEVCREKGIEHAFHDGEEIGPRMLSRIAKHTGLQPDDL